MVPYVIALFVVGPIAALLIMNAWKSGVVHVDDSFHSPLPLASAEQRTFASLGTIVGTNMSQVGPQQYAVVSSRCYPWAILFAILVFPIGLLLLLLRQEIVLNVRLAPEGAGTTVQVAGRAQMRVATAVGSSLQQSLTT
jgi:hypothetical protein